jgi:hypothetical protein
VLNILFRAARSEIPIASETLVGESSSDVVPFTASVANSNASSEVPIIIRAMSHTFPCPDATTHSFSNTVNAAP